MNAQYVIVSLVQTDSCLVRGVGPVRICFTVGVYFGGLRVATLVVAHFVETLSTMDRLANKDSRTLHGK